MLLYNSIRGGGSLSQGFQAKRSGIRQVGFVPPALPLYRGRDVAMDFVCFSRPYRFVWRACWPPCFLWRKWRSRSSSSGSNPWKAGRPQLSPSSRVRRIIMLRIINWVKWWISPAFPLIFIWFSMLFPCSSHEFPMKFQVSELRSAVESGRSKKLGAPIGDILWL